MILKYLFKALYVSVILAFVILVVCMETEAVTGGNVLSRADADILWLHLIIVVKNSVLRTNICLVLRI